MDEKDFDFNEPVGAVEIFRGRNDKTGETFEFGVKTYFLWENLQIVEEYAHEDDWKTYKGGKYHIFLKGMMRQAKLIYGDIEWMIRYWTEFRKRYPMFIDPGSLSNES